MGHLFYGCESIKYLPSFNWDISKIKNSSYMFNNCKSLKDIPDISKWKTNEVNEKKEISYKYTSLNKLSDIYISNLKVNSIRDINNSMNLIFEPKSSWLSPENYINLISKNSTPEKFTIELIPKLNKKNMLQRI